MKQHGQLSVESVRHGQCQVQGEERNRALFPAKGSRNNDPKIGATQMALGIVHTVRNRSLLSASDGGLADALLSPRFIRVARGYS